MRRPDDDFMAEMYALEGAYLESEDPIVQSGFSGGHERWSAERSPLVEAIDRDGDFLDVGCANGLLAQDVCRWAAARGHHLVPYGIDVGPRLIDLAKEDSQLMQSWHTAGEAARSEESPSDRQSHGPRSMIPIYLLVGSGLAAECTVHFPAGQHGGEPGAG